MGEHILCALVPVVRIFLHGAADDLLQTHRDLRIDLARRYCRFVDLHQRDGNRGVRGKRELPGRHFVEHHAEGV